MSVTVTTSYDYTPAGAAQPVTAPGTSESAPDPDTGTVTGSAGSGGSSAESDVPNGEGGRTHSTKRSALPQGGTLVMAHVTITLECRGTRPRSISLTGSGNVSVSASSAGQCIQVTEVSQSGPDANGVVTTVTNTKKKCCHDAVAPGTGMSDSTPGDGELAALDAGHLKLDRRTLQDFALLKNLLK